MKRSPLALARSPRGSAVLAKSRLALQRLRGSAASAMVQAFFRLVAGFSAAGCFAGAFLAGAFRAVVLVAGALPSGFSSDFLSAAIKSTPLDRKSTRLNSSH